MWRSNVLRLRKCSSVGGSHRVTDIRRYSSKQSLPISEDEFNDALNEVLSKRWDTEKKKPLGMQITMSTCPPRPRLINACRFRNQRRSRLYGPCLYVHES
jgi:hypothetical protein